MISTDNDTNSKAKLIKLIIFDVDGVMTDGSITYSSSGEELKSFQVRDGLGIKMLQEVNIKTAIITGRKSDAVLRRAKELNIDHVLQGREDKYIASKEVLTFMKLQPHELAYMGDDLPDLAAIQFSGLGICPSEASPSVLEHANLITQHKGGQGAVREACEFILSAQGHLERLSDKFHLSTYL